MTEEQYEAVREDAARWIWEDSHPQRYLAWEDLKVKFPDTVKAIYDKMDQILSDPRIAIVDEDQGLPKNLYVELDATKYQRILNRDWRGEKDDRRTEKTV